MLLRTKLNFIVHINIIIVENVVSITTSGISTAGETYKLVCLAVTKSTSINWSPVPSGMVITTGSMSTLTFSPLTVSYAGTYTCTAMIGTTIYNATETITVHGKCSKCTL